MRPIPTSCKMSPDYYSGCWYYPEISHLCPVTRTQEITPSYQHPAHWNPSITSDTYTHFQVHCYINCSWTYIPCFLFELRALLFSIALMYSIWPLGGDPPVALMTMIASVLASGWFIAIMMIVISVSSVCIIPSAYGSSIWLRVSTVTCLFTVHHDLFPMWKRVNINPLNTQGLSACLNLHNSVS